MNLCHQIAEPWLDLKSTSRSEHDPSHEVGGQHGGEAHRHFDLRRNGIGNLYLLARNMRVLPEQNKGANEPRQPRASNGFHYRTFSSVRFAARMASTVYTFGADTAAGGVGVECATTTGR